MRHPSLGKLVSLPENEESFRGETQFNGRSVVFEIDRDEDQLEEAIEFASEIVQNLEKFDVEAKKVISKDLLDTYNTGWNEYEIYRKDGSSETVQNPTLNADEFERQFELDSINISGKDCLELWYKPNELFWGHSVYVASFEGTNLNDAQAQLFG